MSHEQKPYEPFDLKAAVESFPIEDRASVFNGPRSPLDWVKELTDASTSRQNRLASEIPRLADVRSHIVTQYREAQQAFQMAAQRVRVAIQIDAANIEAYKANLANEADKEAVRSWVEFFDDLRVQYADNDPDDLAKWEARTALNHPAYSLDRIEKTRAESQPGAVQLYAAIPPDELASLHALLEAWDAKAVECGDIALRVGAARP